MVGDSDKRVFLGRVVAGAAALCAAAWIAGLVQLLLSPDYGGQALDVDFAVFWGAAKLALAEGPLVPFDIDRLNAARALPPGVETFPMLWLYPPGWLVVILPLGLLPFFWAWLLFCVASFLLLAYALRGPSRAVPGAWPLMLGGPAVMITLALGQTALIFAALLVLALEALRRENMMAAGLIIAVMTLKPQLGLAIPVALLAAGYFRTIAWATAGTIAILAASLLWPGIDYWPAFLHGLADGSERIRASDLPAFMVSGYGAAVTLGIDRDTALILQGGQSLLAALVLAWLWSSRAAFDLKAAGLVLCVLLITPYAIYYELVFALVGCLYLARAGVLEGRLRAALAVAIWAAPMAVATVNVTGFLFVPALLWIALVLAVRAALRPAAGRADA